MLMSSLRYSRWFLGLLCLLLIAARISGAHWHLCLDHTEPPATVHIGDIDLHLDESGGHQDTDLKLVPDAIGKTVGTTIDLDLLFAVAALLWLLPLLQRRSVPRAGSRQFAILPSILPLHAPPRAPPL
jgi:hypothetical protein